MTCCTSTEQPVSKTDGHVGRRMMKKQPKKYCTDIYCQIYCSLVCYNVNLLKFSINLMSEMLPFCIF